VCDLASRETNAQHTAGQGAQGSAVAKQRCGGRTQLRARQLSNDTRNLGSSQDLAGSCVPQSGHVHEETSYTTSERRSIQIERRLCKQLMSFEVYCFCVCVKLKPTTTPSLHAATCVRLAHALTKPCACNVSARHASWSWEVAMVHFLSAPGTREGGSLGRNSGGNPLPP
jgi:hypothetical protein